MKNKQTYIIGDVNTSKKKVNKQKKHKKPAKNSQSPKNYQSNSKQPINTAFADAFAKLGVSANDFQKK
tara:strand:- start:1139 stop:1342 length:204 start_codon:yes stop_codon:yes gene_type:complete